MSERIVSMSEQEQLFKVLLEEFQGLKTNMAIELQGLRTNMATELNGLRTNMATELNGLRTNMATELNGLKSDIATELHEIRSTMATKKDIELINFKLDKLSGKMDDQHIENINADNRLLNEIQELKEGVLFVNRKIADAELEINLIKHKKQ
jgi:hypothetical protein